MRLFSCLILSMFLLNGCVSWKLVKGPYDPDKAVPRSLYMAGSSLYWGTGHGLFVKNEKNEFVRVPVGGQDDVTGRGVITYGSCILSGLQNQGIFRSCDEGKTWERLPTDNFEGQYLMGLFRTDTSIVAVVWPRYIYISRDGGNSWSDFSAGMPAPGSKGVCFGGSNGILFAGGYIFSSVFEEGVFRRKPDGNAWEAVRKGLPENYKTRALCFHKGVLYCATEDGVYQSSDLGQLWKPFNQGLTNTMIVSLRVFDEMLYATTNTGGIYKSSLTQPEWQPLKRLSSDHVIYDIQRLDGQLYISADGVLKRPGGVYKMKFR